MKGGCIVSIGIAMAVTALGVIVFFMMNLGWIEERFGSGGVSFAIGGIAVMFVVFFSLALSGAIMFGVSGLWMRSSQSAYEMVSETVAVVPNALRYSRQSSGAGGQAQQRQGPSFPPLAGIEHGARPGQQALSSGGGWGDQSPLRLDAQDEAEREWTRAEQQFMRRNQRNGGEDREVMAR